MATAISIEGGRRIVLPSNVNMLSEHFAMAKKPPRWGTGTEGSDRRMMAMMMIFFLSRDSAVQWDCGESPWNNRRTVTHCALWETVV